MSTFEARWRTMGCDAAVWLEGDRPAAQLEALAVTIRGDVADVATRLTRFEAGSELSRLNADPREVVPASTVMRRFVLAARGAGVRTGGLVDATRLADVEAAGYVESMDPGGAGLAGALRRAPARRAAGPHPDRAYLALDAGIAAVVRPPGVRLDSGGIGKGLAADLAARRVPAGVRYAISIGGDLAVGGPGTQTVDVLRAAGRGGPRLLARPGTPAPLRAASGPAVAHRLTVLGGGVATSGIHARMWEGARGPAHHLIDPATGRPAWTGLVAVTAAGADAVEAEALAKAALLSGPDGAHEWLRRRGGVLQHEDGTVEVVDGAGASRAAA